MGAARRIVGGLFAVAIAALAVLSIDVELAIVPPPEHVVRAPSLPSPAYDVWGSLVWGDEGASPGAPPLDDPRAAVRVDSELLARGERAFHAETFGNEVLLTDVVGLLDGPLGVADVADAIAELDGRATTDLTVAVARDAVIGGRRLRAGERIATGLDVPAGAALPLGIAVRVHRGRPSVGVTCALCHASVDPGSGLVLAGVPNRDLDLGLLLALATNSAALLPHAALGDPSAWPRDPARTIVDSRSARVALPDPAALEDHVDRTLLAWPPGRFDATADGIANPTDVPDAFTAGDHPYGWSGQAAVGPFRGLAVASATPHGPSDPLARAAAAQALFALDPEVYLGVLLQAAPRARFRVPTGEDARPSDVLRAAVGDGAGPGVLELAAAPSYPAASPVAPEGVLLGAADEPFLRDGAALAAWQSTLAPPPIARLAGDATAAHGRAVFAEAGCPRCHGGAELSAHRVIAASEVGTEPSRSRALAAAGRLFVAPARLWPLDEGPPSPPVGPDLEVPIDHLDPHEADLAWARRGTGGGYKTPSLIGLAWTAPYLHDGGVAVGRDPVREVGVQATASRGVPADPRESLRAVVDRRLRAAVIAANRVAGLGAIGITGAGHPYWVDERAGFDEDDQAALVEWLLGYAPDPDALVRAAPILRAAAD